MTRDLPEQMSVYALVPSRGVSGLLYALADAPDERSVWVRDVWKSEDAGETWSALGLSSERLGEILGVPDTEIGMNGLSLGPGTSAPVYLVTSCGVLKSPDGGRSWSSIDRGPGISQLVVDPEDPSVLYAIGRVDTAQVSSKPGSCISCPGDRSLFVSRNGGEEWRPLITFKGAAFSLTVPARSLERGFYVVGSEMGILHLVWDSHIETGIEEAQIRRTSVPQSVRLAQNHPNPFNAETTIRYVLSEPTQVRLMIYDVLGRKVRTLMDQEQVVGQYSVIWDGRDDGRDEVSTGIYFYRLEVDEECREVRRMMLLR